VLDTRKTVPCLRLIDKWGVLIGGGANHRMGLYDMVMIKDNHIAAAGGIVAAVKGAGVRGEKGEGEHVCGQGCDVFWG
jgi:nicotinate-nucleotide pyrophosphorylase (carboxylating)